MGSLFGSICVVSVGGLGGGGGACDKNYCCGFCVLVADVSSRGDVAGGVSGR